MSTRCPACGEAALDDEARFCVACGSPLDAVPAATEPPAASPPRRPADGVSIDAPPAQHPAPAPPPDPPRVLPPKAPVDLPPLMPRWMVLAGVLGLIALLVVLLLSR